jgi:hypothetical protein
MKPIGGYFELELRKGKEYHSNAIRLNLGRTAFEYILRAKKIEKVFLPYYTCDSMLEPIFKTGIPYELYHIDKNLEPVFNYASLKNTDYFLYINYFGLKDKFIEHLGNNIGNLIIDNSQAFFSIPRPGADTFYSPRKFFGLPDGGYLYTDTFLPQVKLKRDNSLNRFEHLIGRIENGAEKSYNLFIKNEQSFRGHSIKMMSKITQRLLQNIDYVRMAEIRKKNFHFLNNKLGSKNELIADLNDDSVPMVYPLFSKIPNLRNYLIQNKVYVAQYWPNILSWCDKSSIEYLFTEKTVFLPIDQRITLNDLDRIVKLILNFNESYNP